MKQNSLKFAITGGIGSGKSTVAEIIKRKGYAVFSCDEIYKELLLDAEFKAKLSLNFDGIISADGSLDRSKLSEIVFNDKSALKRLNALTHPAIIEEVLKKSSGQKISFTEVPLLFESGLEKYFDGIIVILRDMDKRIAAVSVRDKIDRERAILRIKSQLNYENYDFAKYYVIHNDSNFEDLKAKTENILEKII
jgi:dephospho-CoA kinase